MCVFVHMHLGLQIVLNYLMKPHRYRACPLLADKRNTIAHISLSPAEPPCFPFSYRLIKCDSFLIHQLTESNFQISKSSFILRPVSLAVLAALFGLCGSSRISHWEVYE